MEELPQLYMPIGQAAIVPDKLYYYHFKRNDHSKPKVLLQQESKGQQIRSKNIIFEFDENGLVESVTYLVRGCGC